MSWCQTCCVFSKEFGVLPFYNSKSTGTIFLNQKVVLTGTLMKYKRSDAQKLIEQMGGECMSSVSKLTTMVLAGENAGSKLDKARSLGIRIVTEEEFDNMISSDVSEKEEKEPNVTAITDEKTPTQEDFFHLL